MMANTLSDSESRLFRSYWQDGSLDLSAGLALVATGVFWLTGPVVGQTLAPVLGFVIYSLLRKRVIEPRLGHVRFGEDRRSRLRMGYWVAIGAGLGILGLGVVLYFSRADIHAESSIETVLIPGLPAALVGLMALGVAMMLGLKRFLVYAAVLLAAALAIVGMEAHPGWALLAGGVVVTLSGCVMLLRFLREFPVGSSELE